MDPRTPTTPTSSPLQSKPLEDPITETHNHTHHPILPPPPSKRKANPHRKPKPRKTKNSAAASAAASSSPRRRNPRRTRRRPEEEIDIKEDKELVLLEGNDVERPRKRRHCKKTNVSLACSSSAPEIAGGDCHRKGDSVWDLITDLVMWKNVAKSMLWFGSGSIFFMSSSFSRDSNFSIISAASHLGILVLGLAFFRDSFSHRQQQKPRGVNFQLTEEDFQRAARLILPTANVVLAKGQKVFSGEPLMTLKVSAFGGTSSSLHSEVWSPHDSMEDVCNWVFLELYSPQTLLLQLREDTSTS